MFKDSIGIRLLDAFTSVSFGACDKSFDKNLAASVPPRFSLYKLNNLSFSFSSLFKQKER